MRSLLATVLVAGTLFSAVSANAEDRRVVIHNASKEPIYNLYGSNESRTDQEEDILGNKVLMGGDSIRVDFDDGSGHCTFDFRVRYKSGRIETEYGVNVCQISEYTFR